MGPRQKYKIYPGREFIRKQRLAAKTLLIYTEGLGEAVFLKYLRSIYSKKSGTAVTIKNGKGGTADNIVIGAANTPGGFDRKIVVLDNDKNEKEMARARTEAKVREIELIENTPCLEAELLSILNEGKDYSKKKSNWCKKTFQNDYMSKKNRSIIEKYDKVFPSEFLNEQVQKNRFLMKIVSAIRN